MRVSHKRAFDSLESKLIGYLHLNGRAHAQRGLWAGFCAKRRRGLSQLLQSEQSTLLSDLTHSLSQSPQTTMSVPTHCQQYSLSSLPRSPTVGLFPSVVNQFLSPSSIVSPDSLATYFPHSSPFCHYHSSFFTHSPEFLFVVPLKLHLYSRQFLVNFYTQSLHIFHSLCSLALRGILCSTQFPSSLLDLILFFRVPIHFPTNNVISPIVVHSPLDKSIFHTFISPPTVYRISSVPKY